MKKIFILNVDNVIDIITNSSSELFILKADSRKIVEELLESVYPEYLREYESPKQLKDFDDYELKSYINWVYESYSMTKNKCEVFKGFTFDEMYEKCEDRPWETKVTYQMKRDFVSSKNRDKIINAIDPHGKTWLLYSIDENPNWEMQEKLQNIAQRHHLG